MCVCVCVCVCAVCVCESVCVCVCARARVHTCVYDSNRKCMATSPVNSSFTDTQPVLLEGSVCACERKEKIGGVFKN